MIPAREFRHATSSGFSLLRPRFAGWKRPAIALCPAAFAHGLRVECGGGGLHRDRGVIRRIQEHDSFALSAEETTMLLDRLEKTPVGYTAVLKRLVAPLLDPVRYKP